MTGKRIKRLEDSAPRTEGKTRAEYVQEIIDQANIKPKSQIEVRKTELIIKIPVSVKQAGQALQKAIDDLTQATQTALASVTAMGNSLQAQTLQTGLRELSDMASYAWVEEMVVIYGDRFPDPIGFACDLVGFERFEVKDARPVFEWAHNRLRLEVDLVGTDWEPDYVVGFHELRYQWRQWLPGTA